MQRGANFETGPINLADAGFENARFFFFFLKSDFYSARRNYEVQGGHMLPIDRLLVCGSG